jgi:hypothetical protein
MGHAENKCEVRFAMEQDDGVRNWSAEIRADTRKQGGRLSSRWLREEKYGRSETGGSSAAGQANPTVRTSGGNSSNAELADHHTSHNSQPANYLPIMSPINNLANTNYQPTTSQTVTNAIIIPNSTVSNTTFNTSSLQSITHPLTLQNASNIPLLTTNQIPSLFQDNQSSIIKNQSFPITLNQPKNTTLIPQSLTHNMSFTSPPITRAQPHTKQPSQKITRVHKTVSNRTGNKPDQNPIQPRPEKKPKSYEIFTTPTLNPAGPTTHQHDPVDHEAQCEKKRRREEENSEKSEVLQENDHFLTAGPGSQDCRDQ